MSLLSILKNKLRSLVPVSRTYMDNKLKEHSNWKMLDRQSGEFTQAKGQEVMESFLKSYDDIDVVIFHRTIKNFFNCHRHPVDLINK